MANETMGIALGMIETRGLVPAIEAAAQIEGTIGVYVEIVAKPGHRTKKPVPEALAVNGDSSAPLTLSAEPAPNVELIAD